MKKMVVLVLLVLGTAQIAFAQGVLRKFEGKATPVALLPADDPRAIRNGLVHDIAGTSRTAKPGMTMAEAFRKFDEIHALRVSVDDAQDHRQAVIYELQMVELAGIMQRNDILCWQLNNVAWYIILEFKGRTGYDERITQLAVLDKKYKKAALEELKKDVQNNLPFLRIAKPYLQQAWELNEKITVFDVNTITPDVVLKDALARTKAIENNLRFIDWVENFGAK